MALVDPGLLRNIFKDVIQEGEENIEVVGMISQRTFSLYLLEKNRQDIIDLLSNVKVEVFDDESGTEFLSHQSAHYDQNGIRWTSDLELVDQLMMLGLGIEMLARLAVPTVVERRYFPGGMPLYRKAF